jgi:hypothetical protein
MGARQWFAVLAIGLTILSLAQVVGAQTFYSAPHEGVIAAGAETAVPQAPADSTKSACAGESCACDVCCCPPVWNFFVDTLYLRPGNTGVEYAVPFHGPIQTGAVPLQVGRTAMVDPDYQLGLRVGASRSLDNCSSISATYMYYRNSADDAITVDVPFVLRSMVMHPETLDAAGDGLSANAHETTGFDVADLDFRHILYCNDCWTVNYLVGLRYVDLKQQFNSTFENILVTQTVDSGVDFAGGGLRFGLDGRWEGCNCGFFGFSKGAASLVGAEFRANYQQTARPGGVLVQTTWNEYRPVTILDGEIGVGWRTCSGHFETSIGYMVSGWLNVVKPSDFIAGVQANQYRGALKMGESSLEFDGFVARAEFIW